MQKDTNTYAAIDIGTNSTLLLVAAGNGRKIIPLIQKQVTTRLGKGLGRHNRITKTSLHATQAVVTEFKHIAEAAGAKRIIAVGTHVFRTAENGKEALRTICQKTGLRVQLLSPANEARLSFFAARSGLHSRLVHGQVILVDIGGGSTEIIAGDGRKIKQLSSFPIGAVTLTERFLKHDPAGDREYQAMQEYIRENIPLHKKKYKTGMACRFMGVAGTITTLAAMDLGLTSYNAQKVHGHILTFKKIGKIQAHLRKTSLAARRGIPGLPADRSDIILAGTSILYYIMNYFSFKNIIVSDRGLRFGVILQEMQIDCARQKS